VLSIAIGLFLIALALLPGFKFYEGRLGLKPLTPPIEPTWIGRLVFVMFGLAAILNGIWEIRRGSH